MSAPGWFDPKLSVGNVITIIVVAGGIMAGWYSFDNRLALAEDRAERQRQDDERERIRVDTRLQRVESDRDDIKTRVIRIEEQLRGQDTKLDAILRNTQAREPGRN